MVKTQKNYFSEKVYSVVKKIPAGKVLTYKEVSKKAGREKAFRAVGSLMKKNYDKSIPCHRVVKSDKSVGEYNRGGSARKIQLLRKEGVIFKNGKVV